MIKQFIQQMEHSNRFTGQFKDNLSSFFPKVLSGSLKEPISHTSLELINLRMHTPICNVMYSNSVVNPMGSMREHADMVKSVT